MTIGSFILPEMGDIFELTYSELVSTINNSGLTTGNYYQITDFQTTHYICNNNGVIYSGGTPFINTGAIERIIVVALDSHTLKPDSYSLDYPDDIIGYDWNPDNWLEDIGFSEDQITIIPNFKGVIYKRYDSSRENLVGYDFRAVKFRRWKKNYPIWSSVTTYAKGNKVQVAGTSGGAYISLLNNNLNKVVSNSTYWAKIIDYAKTEYFEYDNNNAQNVGDYRDCLTFHSLEAGGTYERNIKAVKFTPFKDTQDQFWGSIGGILSNNVFYLLNSGTHSFVDFNFGVLSELNTFMEIGYLNNLGGYFLKNICGTYFQNNNIGTNCFQNYIGTSFNSNIIGTLFNDNYIGLYFFGNNIGNAFQSNIIGSSFQSNSIGNNFQYNSTIGNDFEKNSVENDFKYNSIGTGCLGNIFGSDNQHNTIGNAFEYNAFDGYNYYNEFGNNNKYNKLGFDNNYNEFINNNFYNSFGSDNDYNLFGSYNYYNSFGNYNVGNSFGDDNVSNTFGNSNSNNTFIENNYNNTFGNENSNNSFGYTNTINTFGNFNTYNRFADNSISNIFLNNNIYNNFSGVTIVQRNEFNSINGTGINYTPATHIKGNYKCELYKRPDGNFRLKYSNDFDEIVITDINS